MIASTSLVVGITGKRVNFILDADVRGQSELAGPFRRATAISTSIRQRRLTPSCGELRLYRGENQGLGKE
jgi:hypothetical protein